MTFEQAIERDDVAALCYNVLEYCSVKLGSRLNKLKRDISNNKDKPYINSFLEFAKVDNLDEMDEYDISTICCEYYKKNKNYSTIPEKILGHIKKVGSYTGSVIDFVNCARKEKYKNSFDCIDLHLLDPIFADQPISSWNDIIKKFIRIPKDLEDFKKKCIKNNETKDRLNRIYGGTDTQLDREKNNQLYLHAELNILANIMDQDKGNDEFIAVSKKCCYLCESYIEFVRFKGYKISISGTHKKLYHRWKLPEAFKKEFMEHTLFNLDQIIERGIKQNSSIIAQSDSEGDSADSDIKNYVAIKSMTERAKLKRTNQ
ncbi:5271_t:CDS:1 [Funneliformis geosporum]|uniref:5271_t:CDS:1 n=1 Tax=Funneliformis geosporum TaxID=1117311 RepID=A0A9W4SD10_9GLOM|nr:5271_t:CDS:1 [Funneliformis geosporum]